MGEIVDGILYLWGVLVEQLKLVIRMLDYFHLIKNDHLEARILGLLLVF